MNKPLKIVLFDGSFKTTSFINRLASGLSANHEVFILGFSNDRSTRLKNVNYVSLGSNNSKLDLLSTSFKFALRGSIAKLASTFSLFFSRNKNALQQQNLQLFLSKANPDVIHLQWPSTVPFFESVLEAQEIPVVLSQRGYQNNVRAIIDPINNAYLKQWYPKFAGFHSVSKAMSATGNLLYTSEAKIDQVIYTGVEVSEFVVKKLVKIEEHLKIISVGRPHWIKGYDDAIKACKILKEKSVAFEYQIIGAIGNEELLHLIREYQLENEVILEGLQPQNEVFEAIQHADVLLMPSLHEGIANVAVEAMALGTPVISTQCGGMHELIEDKKEGWLVPSRDAGAMANALYDFTKQPTSLLVSIQEAARKKVETQFKLQQMISDFEQLYRTVIRK